MAAGLAKKDTFYDTEPVKANWRSFVEGRERRKIEDVYNYVSCNGNYAFTKLRLEGKKILYGILKNDRFTYGLPRNTPRKSFKAIYGSVAAINRAIEAGKPVFIPEGEKDVKTLSKQGYTAFTYGGVNDWQSEFSTLVKGADVVILAIDVAISGKERFKGKKTVDVPTEMVVHSPNALIAKIEEIVKG